MTKKKAEPYTLSAIVKGAKVYSNHWKAMKAEASKIVIIRYKIPKLRFFEMIAW